MGLFHLPPSLSGWMVKVNMCVSLASFNAYLCCDISAKSDSNNGKSDDNININNNGGNKEDEDESCRGNRRIVIIFAPSFFPPSCLPLLACYLSSLTSIVFRKPLLLLHVLLPYQPKSCPS